MLFHTWTFLVFFAVVWVGYRLLRGTKAATPWLLIASYVFYGAWRPSYLLLLIYSTVVDYVAVAAMARGRRRRLWLAISLVNNLGLLGVVKYGSFVIGNLDAAAGALGMAMPLEPPGWELPVGISFYTFQSLSYTIDFYRGRCGAEPSFLRFATYVSFFPQLVAGPIERSESLLPQLASPRRITWDDLAAGGSLFLVGLFKKVALADPLMQALEPYYADPSRHGAPTMLLATLAFAWQIYFDFSGYTDMARGVARAFGFQLMVNFRRPYLATGLSDFWTRWHVSLSQWFRDYVYVPLGGNRVGVVRWVVNVMVTFLLSGLWHGAAWHFVLWGAWHGIGLVIMRPIERLKAWQRVPVMFRWLFVQAFVLLGWSWFRVESDADIPLLIGSLVRWDSCEWVIPPWLMFLIAAVWVHEALSESRWGGKIRSAYVSMPLAIAMLIYLALIPTATVSRFIYFQF